MTTITGTAGDDIVIIDDDVITVNGTVFTGTLTGINLQQGDNTVIIKDSTISMENLNLGGSGNNTLEITNSNFSIPEPFTNTIHVIGLNNTTMTVTDSFVQVPNIIGGNTPNDITFIDSTLDTTESDLVRAGIDLGTADDKVTFIRSELTGFRDYIFTDRGDDTVTLIGSTTGHVNLGRDNDTLNISDSTQVAPLYNGKQQTDTLNLPVGTVVNDNQFGTFTVVAGQPYQIGFGTFTLPTGQVSQYARMSSGEPLIVCFCQDTGITTQNGIIAVQDLCAGDMILTMDRGYQKLKWVGARKISFSQLLANPKLRPVRITAGALGQGMPERDLLVSRQHRMLVRSHITKRMFGEDEVLLPAIKLCDLPGIFVDEKVQEVEYFHMLFDTHEIVYAEGAPSESLYTGPEALKALSIQAREEIFTLFPEIAEPDYLPVAARPFPAGKKQKQLVERHKKNCQELLTS